MPFLRVPTIVIHDDESGETTEESADFVVNLSNVTAAVPSNEGWTNLSFVNGLQLTIRVKFEDFQDWLAYIEATCPETQLYSWPYRGGQ